MSSELVCTPFGNIIEFTGNAIDSTCVPLVSREKHSTDSPAGPSAQSRPSFTTKSQSKPERAQSPKASVHVDDPMSYAKLDNLHPDKVAAPNHPQYNEVESTDPTDAAIAARFNKLGFLEKQMIGKFVYELGGDTFKAMMDFFYFEGDKLKAALIEEANAQPPQPQKNTPSPTDQALNKAEKMLANNGPGLVGAAATAKTSAYKAFAKDVSALDEALIALHRVAHGNKDHLPPAERQAKIRSGKAVIEERVAAMSKHSKVMERYFSKQIHSKKGSALTDPQRAINRAKGMRHSEKLVIHNMPEYNRIETMIKRLKYAGYAMFFMDGFVRAEHIYDVCSNNSASTDQCAKTALSEVSSFFASAAGGGYMAGAITTVAISLFGATPVGWLGAIILGSLLGFTFSSFIDNETKLFVDFYMML